MNFEHSSEWQRQWLDAQQRQVEAYEQWLAASRQLLEAQRKQIEIAEQAFKLQMRFLTMWGF